MITFAYVLLIDDVEELRNTQYYEVRCGTETFAFDARRIRGFVKAVAMAYTTGEFASEEEALNDVLGALVHDEAHELLRFLYNELKEVIK